LLLLAMFLITQLIGLFVINQYSPITTQVLDEQGNLLNVTSYNLPYGVEPPSDVTPRDTLISIIIAIAIAVSIMLLLMKYNVEIFFKVWFFVVVSIAMAITFNSIVPSNLQYASLIALIIAIPLSYIKIFKRNIYIHNITELAVYPGIAVIFVPLLNIWTTVILLILISLYDMYAVWHAGFMQKMAHYQIEKLQIFTGFFIPYMGKKQKQLLIKAQNSKSKKLNKLKKKIKVNLAILGGGDVVFPIILAGVVFNALGLIPALIISLGATISLAGLFYISQKGKFYPAMPFITAGCLIALSIAYLI